MSHNRKGVRGSLPPAPAACRSRSIAVGVMMTLMVAACSSCGAQSTVTSTTSPLAAAHSVTAAGCVLVQQLDANGLFARDAARIAVDNKARAASVCGYSANSNADPNTIDNITKTLLVYVYDGSMHFTQAKASDSKPVAGLGDDAFQVVRGDLLSVAFTAKGQSVEIDYSITGLGTHPSAGALADKLIAIAHRAADRM